MTTVHVTSVRKSEVECRMSNAGAGLSVCSGCSSVAFWTSLAESRKKTVLLDA